MLLTQARLLYARRQVRPVLLIDDMAAELGARYRQVLAEEIAGLGGQCFLTFLEPSLVPDALKDGAMFHVEHGTLRRG